MVEFASDETSVTNITLKPVKPQEFEEMKKTLEERIWDRADILTKRQIFEQRS
jgi:hypothetical protein